jgi:hypothetical protein
MAPIYDSLSILTLSLVGGYMLGFTILYSTWIYNIKEFDKFHHKHGKNTHNKEVFRKYNEEIKLAKKRIKEIRHREK